MQSASEAVKQTLTFAKKLICGNFPISFWTFPLQLFNTDWS